MKSTVSKMEAENRVVAVKMKDGTSLTGRVKSGNESFTVAAKDGPRTVSYADVAQVKKKGMHPAKRVAIGVGVAVAVLIGIAVVLFAAECSSSRGCPD
jgi:archaeosine-15-forming tRNA-guanine transglycosylase